MRFGADSGADNTARVFAEATRRAIGHTTNAMLIRKLPYDPVEGFTAITMMSRSQGFALIVAGNSRFRTIKEHLAAARAAPGKITYGSSGICRRDGRYERLVFRVAVAGDAAPAGRHATRARHLVRQARAPAEFGAYVSIGIERYKRMLSPLGIQVD